MDAQASPLAIVIAIVLLLVVLFVIYKMVYPQADGESEDALGDAPGLTAPPITRVPHTGDGPRQPPRDASEARRACA